MDDFNRAGGAADGMLFQTRSLDEKLKLIEGGDFGEKSFSHSFLSAGGATDGSKLSATALFQARSENLGSLGGDDRVCKICKCFIS